MTAHPCVRSFLPILAVLLVGGASLAACGGDDDDSAARAEACETRSWSASTPGEVVCPGASTCACTGDQVCCVSVNDDQSKILGSECTTAGACQELPMACDGPEDCGGGEVCCLSDSGASCTPEANCLGFDKGAFCHATTDCSPVEECLPSSSNPYDGLTAVCG